MTYKLSSEFKKTGYETILLTTSHKEKWDIDWYRDAYDKIICSDFQLFKPTPKNLFDMLKRTPHLLKSIYEMSNLKPYAVFGISAKNYIIALALRFFKRDFLG